MADQKEVVYVFQDHDGYIWGAEQTRTPQMNGKINAELRREGAKGVWLPKSALSERDLSKRGSHEQINAIAQAIDDAAPHFAALSNARQGKCVSIDELREEAKDAGMKPLPPDPENMNDERADWAESALQAFEARTHTDREDALGDLLGDLMHWADRNNFDFDAAFDRAKSCYRQETGADPFEMCECGALPLPGRDLCAKCTAESKPEMCECGRDWDDCAARDGAEVHQDRGPYLFMERSKREREKAAEAKAPAESEASEGVRVALELALADQENWLNSGNAETDYGAEWPEVRVTKAASYRQMARAALLFSVPDLAAQLEELAKRVLGEADETQP